jgi:hypothetical protein
MSRAARVPAGNSSDSKNRLFSALISIPSPQFPEHDFPRLTAGENTEIERGETSPKYARLEETNPEQSPDRNTPQKKFTRTAE